MFDKTHNNVKYFMSEDCYKFSKKQGNKRTLNDFPRKFGTISSTERTASVGRYCAIFSFAMQVEWNIVRLK